MSIPYGSPPDLIFYYSVSNEFDAITSTTFGTSILQTIDGPVFADQNLTEQIGKWCVPAFIYDINNPNNNGFYDSTGTQTFFLPNGSLSVFDNTLREKNSQGNYIVIPGIYTLQIVGGTENFLNATGFINKIVTKTPTRQILVYFNK